MPIRVVLVTPEGRQSRSGLRACSPTLTARGEKPCDASHSARRSVGLRPTRLLVGSKNRIGQVTESESGEQAAEPRMFGAELRGGSEYRLVHGRPLCRSGERGTIRGGSLGHAEPSVQGLSLPVGVTRAGFNIDAVTANLATMLTTYGRSGYISSYFIQCYRFVPGVAPGPPSPPGSLLQNHSGCGIPSQRRKLRQWRCSIQTVAPVPLFPPIGFSLEMVNWCGGMILRSPTGAARLLRSTRRSSCPAPLNPGCPHGKSR